MAGVAGITSGRRWRWHVSNMFNSGVSMFVNVTLIETILLLVFAFDQFALLPFIAQMIDFIGLFLFLACLAGYRAMLGTVIAL
jgi:hypothetical protein